jgi:glycosyltransferase involved in cell wall biosynthesis
MTSECPIFLVVTPAFRSAALIDETILSVVSQAGDFRIRYHVQDGGSADGTLAVLDRWASMLASGSFPILCTGVEFSFRSEKDSGMYDAINRGFDHLNPSGGEHMTYINADDRLLPGAFQFAATIFRSRPEIAWLSGRPCEMNEQGELMRIHDAQVYPSASLRAGLHDGRIMPFVMQEGTFWRGALWKKAGGFRASLRQAGDWDLWRRFAAETACMTTDTVLAAHRRREAQLTADKSIYYHEVDEVISQEFAGLHAAELARFRAWEACSEDERDQRFYGGMLRFHAAHGHGGSGEWQTEDRPYQAILRTTVAVTNGFTCAMLPAEFESGFAPLSNVDHALHLLPGFHVSNAAECSFRFHAGKDGLHRIFLRCRNFDSGVHLRLFDRARTLLNAEMPVTSHDRDCLVIAEAVFHQGANVISMRIAGQDPEKTPVLVVVSCEAMSTI